MIVAADEDGVVYTSVQDVVNLVVGLRYKGLEDEGWKDDLVDLLEIDGAEVTEQIASLWAARGVVEGLLNAAKRVQDEIDKRFEDVLGAVGRVRLDDYLVSVKRASRTSIVDQEGLIRETIELCSGDREETIKTLAELGRISARKTSLRAIAKRHELDPEHFIDTYCETTEGEPKLAKQALSDSKTPKYAHDMKHLQTRDVPGVEALAS